METETKKKIGVERIEITRAKGPSVFCGKTKVYRSWKDARVGLAMDNRTYPGPGQGYDKHDFKVVFQDGEIYSGRLDVKQYVCQDNDQDVQRHVREFVAFYAGLFEPLWMQKKPGLYQETIKGENQEEYRAWLEKYDV